MCTNLEDITIDISNTYFADNGASKLYMGFKKLNNLKKLELNFSDTFYGKSKMITNKGYEYLY